MAGDTPPEEPLIEFFKGANINAVTCVVERARSMAEKAARRNASASRVSRRPGALVRCMNKAMAAYGRSAKGRPSIRRTASDTGGRPFHYSHSTVTKDGSARGGSTPGGKAAGATPAGKAQPKPKGSRAASGTSTREARHQLYVERADALERGVGLGEWQAVQTGLDAAREVGTGLQIDEQGIDATHRSPDRTRGPDPAEGIAPERDAAPEVEGRDAPAREQGTGRDAGQGRSRGQTQARDWVDAELSDGPGLSDRTTERAAQQYIEDPSEAPEARTGMTASFGTIGETVEERLRFWDLVHEHESDKGGRTQTRLVLELPHEATARQRHEIVRRFTDEFQARGIPYWASIHAPTGRNDARNHHAHIVLTERPMRRMSHPETGQPVWDFTVREDYRTTSRHTRTRYPHRQSRDPAMRDRGYVRASRARFAAVVNEVMEGSASPVRYDARSYEAMGVNAEPMRNVARILADKLDKRQFVVIDAEWTRRTIDAEMQIAAARRDATFAALQDADQRLRGIAQEARRSKLANARLPPHLRLSPGRVLAQKAQDLVMSWMLGVRRDRLATRFVDEATLAALRHVASATAPPGAGTRKRRVHDPETAPDPGDLAALHAAAIEEIAALGLTSRARQAALAARETELAREWREGGPGSGGAASGAPGAGAADARAEGVKPGTSGQGQPVQAQVDAGRALPMPAPRTRTSEPPREAGSLQRTQAAPDEPGARSPVGLIRLPSQEAASPGHGPGACTARLAASADAAAGPGRGDRGRAAAGAGFAEKAHAAVGADPHARVHHGRRRGGHESCDHHADGGGRGRRAHLRRRARRHDARHGRQRRPTARANRHGSPRARRGRDEAEGHGSPAAASQAVGGGKRSSAARHAGAGDPGARQRQGRRCPGRSPDRTGGADHPTAGSSRTAASRTITLSCARRSATSRHLRAGPGPAGDGAARADAPARTPAATYP